MLFFIPLCDAYAPVILLYFGPFVLTLGAYILFVLLRLDLCSFFVVMLAKSPTLRSAVSLNIMLIPIHVFRRQTVLCVWCARPMITPYTHHGWTRGNVKNGQQMYTVLYTTKADERWRTIIINTCFYSFYVFDSNQYRIYFPPSDPWVSDQ